MSTIWENGDLSSPVFFDGYEDGALGYHPCSEYVERFWLPLIGPSATLLVRHVARMLDNAPDGIEADLAEMARSLGLGDRLDQHAPFPRTLGRVITFKLATLHSSTHLGFRRRIPRLSPRNELRLPHALRKECTAAPDQIAADHERVVSLRTRGEQLALSLLRLGERPEEAERQLIDWNYHPTLAGACTRRACEINRAWADGQGTNVEPPRKTRSLIAEH